MSTPPATSDPARPDPAWDIRVAGTFEAAEAYAAPLPAAFAEDITPEQFEDWRATLETDRFIGAFDGPGGTQSLGCAGAISFRLTVPGGELPAAGVTFVAVRPDQHRRGILRALMHHQLADVHARGEPIAILWASEGAIYQRFGYGLATLAGTLEVDPRQTAYARPSPAGGRLRLVGEEEAGAVFPPVYEAMRRTTPGAVSRSEAWWRTGPLADREHARRGAGPKLRYLYEADGAAEGYVMYRVRPDWDHRGPKGVLDVVEVVALTPRAGRDVWRFLFEVDLVRTVRAGRLPVPLPMQHLLAEPRALGLHVGDGIWLRLVDLAAALAGRTYGGADELVLEVADPTCPWNAGRWLLATTGEAGSAAGTATRTERAPDLVLDTSDLAAIYLGGVRVAVLAESGRVTERTPGAIRRADRLFVADRTPCCVTMF
jgi:predicted acetyltransferase